MHGVLLASVQKPLEEMRRHFLIGIAREAMSV